MDFRLFLAILTSKILALVIKLFGGGGTAAPGLVALKIDPKIVKKISSKIKNGNILISGTNGKTTTSRIASDILSSQFKVIHNRQGSNLLRGIASTLIKESSILGKIEKDLAVWETDEATLPQAILNTSPKAVILLNLFRDQLDRYGEVDTTRNLWQKALTKLPAKSLLILNSDDPGIAYLARLHKGKSLLFGLASQKIKLPEVTHVEDVKNCPICFGKLKYMTKFSAHMGDFQCLNCDYKKENPHLLAKNIKFGKNFTTSLTIKNASFDLNLRYAFPGLYNIYNVLAAVEIALYFGINPHIIKKKLIDFESAFGRFQKVNYKGKNIFTFLIKNPTGANEVIRTLALQENLNLLVILNDNFADGRDVSWIWDTDWEKIAGNTKSIKVAGQRAWDMATRLKYAGFKLSKKDVNENLNYSINTALDNLSQNDTLLILPTYTALLQAQKHISKSTGATKWQNQ